MELHRKYRLSDIVHTFIRSVVYIYKSRLRHTGRDTLRKNNIAVVLGRDVATSGLQILHRMVAAAMAVLHLRGIAAGRQSRQLMPQTDREHRNAGMEQRADLVNDWHAVLGIARAIAEHDAVRLVPPESAVRMYAPDRS